MSTQEQFLSKRNRYQPITLPEEFSEEEMARDWTLAEEDKAEINRYRRTSRVFIAIQMCAVRLYGRFVADIHNLSPRIINYLNIQLGLPPSLRIQMPSRETTQREWHKQILDYLGFQRFDDGSQKELRQWVEQQARQGTLPSDLFQQAEEYLFERKILLPGPTTIERLIIHVCGEVHDQVFESIYQGLSVQLRTAIDQFLSISEGEQRSYFYQLKEDPPAAKISSLRSYLKRYQTLAESGIDSVELRTVEPAFQEYLFELTRKYNANELKRFDKHKRYDDLLSARNA